jgi:hypothetical protein
MNSKGKKPSKVTPVLRDTRTWSSGNIKFTVLTVEGHPESNYITLQKILIGKPSKVGLQRFMENPELVDKILEAPNLKSLSSASFEYLNRLAMKVFRVQSKNLDLVLKNLAKASPREFIQFASLLTDLRLGQVATLANLVKQKLEIIGLFEKLTTQEKTREKEIHKVIEQNPWIANKSYEILASDKPLTDYLSKNAKDDPELKMRPDLIAKRVPYQDQIVLIELKRPAVKLKSTHIGQILEYRDLILQFKPGTKSIDCFLFGYQKQHSSLESKDVTIRTFSELASSLRDEYQAYLKVLEEDSGASDSMEATDTENEIEGEDIPF